jgi:hypothetical protein
MLRPLSFCPSDIFLSHLDFGLDHETLVSLGGLWMNRWVHPVFLDWGPAHLNVSCLRRRERGCPSFAGFAKRNNFSRPPVSKYQTGAGMLASGLKDDYRQICANPWDDKETFRRTAPSSRVGL